MQLALLWGARVFTTGTTTEELAYLREISSDLGMILVVVVVVVRVFFY